MTLSNAPSAEADSSLPLALWTPGPFAERLKISFEMILSQKEWEVSTAKARSARLIVVLAELNWDNIPYSSFHGFDIVRRLRAELHVRCPVVICSFLPYTYFVPTEPTKIKPRFELLAAPGHTFLRLPIELEDEKLLDKFIRRNSVPSISDELLDDIVESLCDPRGLANEILHRLKNAVVTSSKSETDVRQQILSAIENSFIGLGRLFPGDSHVSLTKQRLLEEMEQHVFSREDYARAIEVVGQFSGDIERLVPLGLDELPTSATEVPWYVFYIEDESHICDDVHTRFAERGLKCVTASSVEEVDSVLKQDLRKNNITVVITDYRLETHDGLRKWQGMQGPQVIEHIILSHKNFVSFFALTAASRRALLRIQRTYQVKVYVFSKEDVLSSDGAFNMFAEDVRREGERVFESVCSQPQLTSWTTGDSKFAEPLKNYYRAHRLAMDYESAEADISARAKAYVENIVEVDETSSQPPGHKFQFQTSLPKGSSDPSMMPKFREKLIGRRIAVGLYVLLGYYPESIYLAMRKSPFAHGNDIPSTLVDEAKQNLKPLLSTHLALSLVEDIPDHLLIEERAWLTGAMAVDLNEENRIAYTAIEAVAETFKEDLKDRGCNDDPGLKLMVVRSFAAARDVLANLKKLAEENGMTGRFAELLKETYEEATPGEKRAFRSSGMYSLFREHVGRKAGQGTDNSEYPVQMED